MKGSKKQDGKFREVIVFEFSHPENSRRIEFSNRTMVAVKKIVEWNFWYRDRNGNCYSKENFDRSDKLYIMFSKKRDVDIVIESEKHELIYITEEIAECFYAAWIHSYEAENEYCSLILAGEDNEKKPDICYCKTSGDSYAIAFYKGLSAFIKNAIFEGHQIAGNGYFGIEMREADSAAENYTSVKEESLVE